MNVYATEQEQIEQLKQWAKTYGPTIIITIGIVLVLSFSWRYWQGHQEEIRAQASQGYEQLLIASYNNDKKTLKVQAEFLIKEYPGTPYSKMAALILAKEAVAEKNYPEAEKYLRWVIESAQSSSLKQIARMRLARVLLAENRPQDALQTLTQINDPAYRAGVFALQGEIYFTLGNKDEASKAYQQALAIMPKNATERPLIQMKLNELTQGK